MTECLAVGLAFLVIVATPIAVLSALTRRGPPPSNTWAIRRNDRKRRIRLGLH